MLVISVCCMIYLPFLLAFLLFLIRGILLSSSSFLLLNPIKNHLVFLVRRNSLVLKIMLCQKNGEKNYFSKIFHFFLIFAKKNPCVPVLCGQSLLHLAISGFSSLPNTCVKPLSPIGMLICSSTTSL